MDKFSIPDRAAPYTDALRNSIQTGLNGWPRLESSPLINLPLVLNITGAKAAPEVRAHVFLQEFELVIANRLRGMNQKCAQVLFGLGENAGIPARNRYSTVATLFEKNWTWEKFRKEPLDRLLVAVFIALWREAEVAKFTPAAEVSIERGNGDILSVGGDYVIDSYEQFYNLPQRPGQAREYLTTRRVRALRDGVDAWRQSVRRQNMGDEAELPETSLFGPGTLSVTDGAETTYNNQPVRIHRTEVRFPQPLQAKATHEFSIFRRYPGRFESLGQKGRRSRSGLRGIVVPIDHAKVSIRFPDSIHPSRIWHYEDLPDWLAPGVQTEDSSLIIDASSCVTFSWDNLRTSYCYGIAWEW